VTSKASIVASLGERKLALPAMINEALGANDRIKYLFTVLQAARHQADEPLATPPRLRNERLQSASTTRRSTMRPWKRSVSRPIVTGYQASAHSRADTARRRRDARPIVAAEDELNADERAQFERRASGILQDPRQIEGEVISGAVIDSLTRAQREQGDSAHILVMDMHRALNRLQQAVAGETLDGAAVYELAPQDRPVVQAFMSGLRRTAPLKFDHPGLGTTATRSGARLVIQNDIGTTDAHVLVVHVEGRTCTLTYTDVHLQRLLFFQSLFARYGVSWDDTRSVRNGGMEDGLYHLALGRYESRTTVTCSTTSHSWAHASCS